MNHPRALALALSLTLVAGACGGASGSYTATSESAPATADEPVDAGQPTDTDEPVDAGQATDTDEPVEDAAADAAPPAESVIPDVDVVDLATGETVNLASFAPADRPILLWFWAPH